MHCKNNIYVMLKLSRNVQFLQSSIYIIYIVVQMSAVHIYWHKVQNRLCKNISVNANKFCSFSCIFSSFLLKIDNKMKWNKQMSAVNKKSMFLIHSIFKMTTDIMQNRPILRYNTNNVFYIFLDSWRKNARERVLLNKETIINENMYSKDYKGVWGNKYTHLTITLQSK